MHWGGILAAETALTLLAGGDWRRKYHPVKRAKVQAKAINVVRKKVRI